MDLRPEDWERIEAALERLEKAAPPAAADRGAGAGAGNSPLLRASKLRRELPPALAARAAELAHLRERAGGRLEGAARLLLTRKGLEQASRSSVARLRALTIARRAAGAHVLDATCGIGADALELAAAGLRTTAADRDFEHAWMAGRNLERAGHAGRALVCAAEAPAVSADLLTLDPDRRAQGARSLDPHAWSPGWSVALQLAARHAGAVLKLAPAFSPDALGPAALPAASALTWTSCARELLECSLWTGCLVTPGELAEGSRCAQALQADGELAHFRGEPLAAPALAPDEAARCAWLCDPDPALVCSGLLGAFALAHELRPVDAHIAFLGGEQPPSSALVRSWRVRASCPADDRRVRALLREHGVGAVRVLRRGHPLASDELERRWSRGSGASAVVAVARIGDAHLAWLLEPHAHEAR